jgi:hypothetical protein
VWCAVCLLSVYAALVQPVIVANAADARYGSRMLASSVQICCWSRQQQQQQTKEGQWVYSSLRWKLFVS